MPFLTLPPQLKWSMKLKLVIFAAMIISSVQVKAQSLSRVTQGIDIGVGSDFITPNALWSPSASYHQELSLKNFSMFQIGWGVRAYGSYNSGRTDLAPKNSATSFDTLSFGKISSTGISFMVGASVKLWKVEIGVNTDLVGIAFGTRRRGLYSTIYQDGAGAEFNNKYVYSAPSVLNALPLVFDNQNGQSEIYARIWIIRQIGIKLGFKYGRNVYSAEEKLDNEQTRYSKSYGMPFAALSFPIFN